MPVVIRTKEGNAMKWRFGIFIVSVCAIGSAAWADSLELKNGSLIKGQYMGGTDSQISFRVGSSIQQYAVSDVASLTFDSTAPSSTPSNNAPGLSDRSSQSDSSALAPASPAPSTATTSSTDTTVATGSRYTVPTGAKLVVRTIDSIDSDKNHVGDTFKASLDQAIFVDGKMVAPKGADVYGRLDQAQEAGHIAGKAQLKLSLTGVVINGQTFPLSTGDYELSGKSRGSNTAKKVGGGAAAGALIGAIVGGGKGAAVGAGVGAGAGTAVQVATKGDQVHVPSETILEFSLAQPLSLPSVAVDQ
jgi:hypothetical protein